jgi:hypothetical protein
VLNVLHGAQYNSEMTALRSDALKRLVIDGYGVNGYIFILMTGLCIFLQIKFLVSVTSLQLLTVVLMACYQEWFLSSFEF